VSADATSSRPGAGARHASDAVDPVPRRPGVRRFVVLAAVTLVLVALVRSLLVQSFVVPTGSMEPTVRVGDRVLVSRLAYRWGDVRRGDVVVFDGAGVFDDPEPPASSPLAQAGRGVAVAFGVPVGSHDYVKRVVGVPGDRVACCRAEGRITVNGKPLVEPYLHPGGAGATPFDVVVPAGRLWVMGDHRAASADSRAHRAAPGGGTVPVDQVVGRVVGIYWPLAHAGAVGRGR
jgi:signal peptidase I